MLYRLGLVMAALLFIASCSESKKATRQTKKDQVVDLDTVEITVSRDNPYRASATREFDLVHTKLEVSFNYEKQHLSGKATLTLKPHFYPQSTLVLDAKQFSILEVSAVKAGDMRIPLSFTYDSLQMKITLDKEYKRDETLTIMVYYTAKPNERKSGGSSAINSDKGLFFINPLGTDTDKPIQIWTQGETESNSCWFPTIDKPNQKTTDEIYITHLKKYVSLSNGNLISSHDNGDSTVTDYWKMYLPHAPYLMMMAIGDFAIVSDRWRDVPVNYYVEPKYAQYAKQVFGNTPEMIEFFSQRLGFEYPWPRYSQVVVRDYVSGAMENTSATLHGEFLNRNSRELLDETYEDVISHELFHQWFGDLVTTESWSNLPLNESFATYGEYMWNEYKYGRDYADYKKLENFEKYLEESLEKNVDLVRFYYDDREDMFDRHSYEKGGLVLYYLRRIVGDEAFLKSLELYLKTNQFKAVEIHQLRLAFEEITGRDLNWFFNQWFLNQGHPILDIKYSYTPDSVFVNIEQKHNNDKGLVYTLPMRIAVHYGNDIKTYDIELNKKKQVFAFKAQGTPSLIDADAERAVLCVKKENKTLNEYIFQYNHATNFMQRYEALLPLIDAQKNNNEAAAALATAMKDRSFYLRQMAIDNYEMPKAGYESIAATLETLAQNDSSSHVRKSAIAKLAALPTASNYTALFENAVGDSSYQVSAAGIRGLYDANAVKGIEVAKRYENEVNTTILSAVADVYSQEADASYASYFRNKLRTSTGINKYYMFYYYANYLNLQDKNTVATGIEDIEAEAMRNTDSHWLMGAAKGSLKRIVKMYDDKKKRAKNESGKEDGQTAKLELQEKMDNYDAIIFQANDALSRLNKVVVIKKN